MRMACRVRLTHGGIPEEKDEAGAVDVADSNKGKDGGSQEQVEEEETFFQTYLNIRPCLPQQDQRQSLTLSMHGKTSL